MSRPRHEDRHWPLNSETLNWDDFPWNVHESKRLIEIIVKQSKLVVDAIIYYKADIGCSQLDNALKDLSKLREDE